MTAGSPITHRTGDPRTDGATGPVREIPYHRFFLRVGCLTMPPRDTARASDPARPRPPRRRRTPGRPRR